MVDGLMAKIIPIGYKEKQKAMQTGKKTQISKSIRRKKLRNLEEKRGQKILTLQEQKRKASSLPLLRNF